MIVEYKLGILQLRLLDILADGLNDLGLTVEVFNVSLTEKKLLITFPDSSTNEDILAVGAYIGQIEALN